MQYTLSEDAVTTFRVMRAATGVRRGGRCVAAKGRRRAARRCTRFTAVRGSFRHTGRSGANSLRFSGRLRGHALRPGRYRLVATPRDSAGQLGHPAAVAFRIRR